MQIVITGMIGTTGIRWRGGGKRPASEGRARVGKVYRKVSFNAQAQWTRTAEAALMISQTVQRCGVR